MKKSQLRKLIKEYIKGLMNEQNTSHPIPGGNASIPYHGVVVTGPGSCAGKRYLGTLANTSNAQGAWCGSPMSHYQTIANEYGPMANFEDFVFTKFMAGGAPSKCFYHKFLHLYTLPLFNHPGGYGNPIMSFPNLNSLKVYTLNLGGQPNNPNSICDLQKELSILGYLLIDDDLPSSSTAVYCASQCEATGPYGSGATYVGDTYIDKKFDKPTLTTKGQGDITTPLNPEIDPTIDRMKDLANIKRR